MSSVFASAVALALAAASPEGAPEQTVAVEISQPSPTEQAIQSHYQHLYAGKFEEALADLQTLQPDDSNKAGQALLAAMRTAPLLGLKRERDARELITRIHQLAPNEPAPVSALFGGAIAVKRFDVAADALDEMIARFPDAVRELDEDTMSYFLESELKGQDRRNDDRRVALARIGYAGDTGMGHWMTYRAVRILMDRGDTAGVNDLLPYLREAQFIENMLIQKRYAAFWPTLEKLGGPHLSAIRSSEVALAERSYQTAPEDHEKLQGYINALYHAGRYNDAIALKSKLPATSGAMAQADQQMGWAVNNLAYTLFETGRLDEADQLLALLNQAPMEDGGWRVSMIINRLEMLVISGKFDKAATLLDATDLSAKDHGSPYAKQLVRKLRYCTLSSLGKKEDAAKLLPDVLAHADDALEATIEGLLCAGDVDRAEQLVLKGLGTADKATREQFEQDVVRALQPVLLTNDDPSVWQDRWAMLRKRPAIAAAYEKLGRDMPAEFLPEKASSAASK